METEKQYIPLNEIPQHIHEAAQSLNHYFEKEGMRYWEFSSVADRRLVNKLERERDELLDAIRNLRDVEGRHHSEIATKRLFALLPENVEVSHGDRERPPDTHSTPKQP